MIARINDFDKKNSLSTSEETNAFWLAVYPKFFTNMVSQMTTPSKKCKVQYAGIDRVILLDNGRTIYIDEKVRASEYNDIIFEYISNNETGTKGWMDKDLSIDYLAYAFLKTKRAYLFDWRVLKRIWSVYRNIWIGKFRRVEAMNNGYITISVAVPIDEVLKRYSGASLVKVSI